MESTKSKVGSTNSTKSIHLTSSSCFCLLVFENHTYGLVSFSSNTDLFFYEPLKIGFSFNQIFHQEETPPPLNENGFGILKLTYKEKVFDAIYTQDPQFSYLLISDVIQQSHANELLNKVLNSHRRLTNTKSINKLIEELIYTTHEVIQHENFAFLQFDEHFNWQIIGSHSFNEHSTYEQMFFPASDWPPFLFEMLHKSIPYIASDIFDSDTQ